MIPNVCFHPKTIVVYDGQLMPVCPLCQAEKRLSGARGTIIDLLKWLDEAERPKEEQQK